MFLLRNKLTTTVYSEPTDSHLNLYTDSWHKKSSIKSTQKDVAFRLSCICGSDNDFTVKSEEYIKYLVVRELNLQSAQQFFDNDGKTYRQQVKIKTQKLRNVNAISNII